MKGVAVFDERANLAFYSLDKDLEKFILCRMQELEKEQAGAPVGVRSGDSQTQLSSLTFIIILGREREQS